MAMVVVVALLATIWAKGDEIRAGVGATEKSIVASRDAVLVHPFRRSFHSRADRHPTGAMVLPQP